MIECWLYWNLQYHGHRHIIIEQTFCNLMGLHCGSLADNITGYWHLHPHFGMPRLDTYCSFWDWSNNMHWVDMKCHIRANADRTLSESTINYI